MKRKFTVLIAIGCFIGGRLACEKILPKAPADDRVLDGPVGRIDSGTKHNLLEAILLSTMKYLHGEWAWDHYS